MSQQDTAMYAVLVGHAATPADASRWAASIQDCPYIALHTTSDRLVTAIYILPDSKEWWLKIPEQNPEIAGLERVRVFITDPIEGSSPWSQGIVKPELERAPCGAACSDCPFYGDRCAGCPATIFFKP